MKDISCRNVVHEERSRRMTYERFAKQKRQLSRRRILPVVYLAISVCNVHVNAQ